MKINGKTFYGMCISAANALDNNKVALNNLNVFPVPDGDTGINMSLTMSTLKDMEDPEKSIADTAKNASNLILRAARGNSGAILSLFFRGMAKSFEGLDVADSKDIAAAFENGTKEAYKAVVSPTEGTILTVMRVCAERAVEITKTQFQGDVAGLFLYIVKVAEEAVAQTPELLPILKQAKVVDAGGSGFLTVLNGMLSFLSNSPVLANQPVAPTQQAQTAANFSSFDTQEITFSYCTEFLLDKHENLRTEDSAIALRDFLMDMGDSMVFVEDESLVKVHIHTNHPGAVMEEALKYGAFSKVKVENMRLQHSEILEGNEKSIQAAAPNKPFGFVAICMGSGICETFRSLGADQIIYGGQTMNPSTQDVVDAINQTPAEHVFVLPNNKNIFMVSEQAAQIVTDKVVHVLPTTSVPQGIGAMMAFDESAEPQDNVEAMTEAASAVKTLSLTHAVRDTELDGVQIGQGQVIALLDKAIVAVADTDEECFEKLSSVFEQAQYLTIFSGKDVTEAEAEHMKDKITAYSHGADITLLSGGQPLYEYIISIE